MIIFLGVLVLVIASQAPRWARRRKFARGRAPITLPTRPHPGARIGCVGSAENQAELAMIGEITPRFFEPIVRWSPAASVPLKGALSTLWYLYLAGAALVCAILLSLGRGGWLTMWSLIGATAGLCAGLMWPTYIRVVPGRVDVLRFGALGRRVVDVQRHDLRSSAVLVDLNQGCVFVADKEGRTAEIGFASAWRPAEVAHAILLAAVSEAEAPPLPDDALVA